jgi:four helix bundle protein
MELKENVIVTKTINFSLLIIEFCEELESKRKFVVANQLLRSGTSIGANIHEAQNAESKADFIHKLSIALKEANETEYWLDLLKETDYIGEKEYISFQADLKEILELLISIIKTSKQL